MNRITLTVALFILSLHAGRACACTADICQVDPETLDLARIITFEDVPSGWDPGHKIDDVLPLSGAAFAERFAGQTIAPRGDFDRVIGSALPPLTLLPGASGQSLSVVNLDATNILNGFGPAGYPRVHGQGEGAIAVLFETDQPALSLQVLGGEQGHAQIQFLRRDGTVIELLTLDTDTSRMTFGFYRQGGAPDIAGFVLTNTDPQGLAIDNLRFGPPPQLG